MAGDHFSRQSAEYARFRPAYPEAFFDWLTAQTQKQESAWDCACGNGQATTALAKRFKQVTGTDLSASQLAHAPTLPNVRWRAAPAEESGLDAASFDLVTVAQALHWFDLPRFWAEVRRVLKPGGVIAVWSYGVFTADDPRVQAACDHYYTEVVGGYWPPERRIVEAGYGSLEFPFEEITAPPFQMQVEWTLDDLLGYLSSWSATVRYEAARGASPLPQLREDLSAVWTKEALAIRWPLSMRIGRGG